MTWLAVVSMVVGLLSAFVVAPSTAAEVAETPTAETSPPPSSAPSAEPSEDPSEDPSEPADPSDSPSPDAASEVSPPASEAATTPKPDTSEEPKPTASETSSPASSEAEEPTTDSKPGPSEQDLGSEQSNGTFAPMAVSPSQVWLTGVSVPGGTGDAVGERRTLSFSSGLTATETITFYSGTCSMGGAGQFSQLTHVSAYMEPDPPASARTANGVCMGPLSGGGARSSRIDLSRPVIAPVVHAYNLDASRLGVSGSGITLTQLAKNNALEVSGTTLNATLQPAINGGCAGNDGTNPNGACGSFRLTAAAPITTFTMANNTANSPIGVTGYNDGWGYSLSYPTAPLTKAFSPARIPAGGTSTLTFTIANPANPTQPTLSPMGFTDTLPAGVVLADGDVTTTPACGSPTVAAAAGAGAVTAGGISVAPGATCAITVNVTSDSAGSYVNDTDNLATTVANLVPDANTTLEVFEMTAFECTPGAAGTLFQQAPTDVHSVDLITGESSQVGSDIAPDNLNAAGYNPTDDYMYAFSQSGSFYRIGSDWSTEELGLPSNWTSFPVPANLQSALNVGEFDADGHYWVTNSNATSPFGWVEIDLSDPSSPTYMEVVSAGSFPMPSGWMLGPDWGYNVEDGDLYATAYMNTVSPVRMGLVRFDTDTRTASLVRDLGPLQNPDGQPVSALFGAVYSDPDGFLYASDNGTGAIWRFDMASGDAEFFATGPASGFNDGARCFNSPLPIDFGDAPNSYGTDLAADGPRHGVRGYDEAAGTAPLMLGSAIDSETDGQPGTAADGDGADEDGVAAPIVMVINQPTTVEVAVTNDTDRPATLAGWIDLNDDGDFADAGERQRVLVGASSGGTTQTLTFPAVAVGGDGTFARFRLLPGDVAAADLSPHGPAAAGEVEDYPVVGPVAVPDYGDAPNSYGTTSGANGARHSVIGGAGALRLGALVDVEPDGQPAAAADGDDVNPANADDEDGVRFNTDVSVPGRLETVWVTASATGYLNAWIDFNLDGDFDAGEQIASDMRLAAGVNQVTYTVPTGSDFVAGDSYARFRITAGAGQVTGPTGLAPNGEVEDHTRALYDAPGEALEMCPTGTTPVPVSIIQNPSFETWTQQFQNASAASTIGYAQHWYDSHPSGGQYHVFSPTFDSGPAASTQPVRAGADGYGFEGGHSATIDGASVGEGAVNTLTVPLNPDAHYVGFFSMAAGGYSRQGDGFMQFMGTNDRQTGSYPNPAVSPQTADNTELLYETPVVRYAGTGTRPTWQLNTFELDASRAWPYLRVEVRNETPAANATVAGQVWMNFDDFHMYECDPVQDFGDAPASYGTDLDDDGPRHTVTDGVHLGALVDDENDGFPGPDADGDDANGAADEDGVAFNPVLGYPGPTLRTGLDPSSQQPVQNTLEVEASADGFVSVWVDWNQDGDFADAGERVANASPVTAGSNDVTFARAENPPGIETFVRVRYSTDAGAIAAPTGPAPDGEVEDYRVLVERLVQPDSCVVGGTEYYAFTFTQPAAADLTGTGGVGSTARYRNVTVVGGVAVDMFVEVVAGDMREAGSGGAPPNGFWTFPPDDAAWQIEPAATLRYSFYAAGTTTPVDVNAVFTVDDLDSPETATFSAGELAGYAVTRGSTVVVSESGGNVVFDGTSDGNATIQQRFQVVFEGTSTFQARWEGFVGSGFGFDGDGDNGIQPPACEDFGDAPDSYGTTLGANGANHTIVPGLLIGSEIDFDADGQPTADATGDDANRTPDEDAFPNGIILNPGVTNPSLTVPVTNTTGGPATLYGWIDSDNNGVFASNEFASIAVPDGAVSVELAFAGIPALQDGTSPFVRLRLTTDPLTDDAGTPNVDERALGAAGDGEVEDHAAQVATRVPISCTDPFVETFGAGTGFGSPLPAGQTSYSYVGAPEPDGMIDAAEYALVTSPIEAHVGWHDGADHTGDADGRMMVVNADVSAGIFFQRTFTGLSPGAMYDFSAWISNVVGVDLPDHPNVTFRVVDPATGVVLASIETGDILESPSVLWERFALQFSAAQSTVRLELVNNTPGSAGNDLAIDDISLSPVCEFGDAPARYGTLIADDGAGHIAAGPTLGTARDTEPDGQPNATADGDDVTGTPDDEDGIAGPIETSLGAEPSVTISVTNDSDRDVTLAGWIDLDGDGQFEDSERQVIVVPADSGTAGYTLDFPAVTTGSDTYARFRLYGEEVVDPRPTGTAAAGEVEDYLVDVLATDLEVEKTSTITPDSRPGDTIEYTVTATNNGPGDFTARNPARVWDDVSAVLDDATYNADATADRGADPVWANPILSWTGPLPAGESVAITYTVTLQGGGDGVVRNVAFGQCDPADPDCDTTTPECDPPVGGVDPATGKVCAESEFELPKLSVTKVADRTDLPAVGERVAYTVTVTNPGPGDYTAAAPGRTTDDLSEVVDAATFDEASITADVGNAQFNAPDELVWEGVLAEGESATITYEVTYTGGGDQRLVNNVCVPVEEAEDPQDACAQVRIPGSGLDDEKVASPASGTGVEVGKEITYTLRFANTGPAAASVDTFDDLAGVLDDADLVEGSLSADNGLTATFDAAQQRIVIEGSVPVGGELEVTYRVRVKPFAQQGDHVLRNVLQCQPLDQACDPDVTEHRVRALDIEKTSTRTPDTVIGDTITYTVTAENIGEADYTAADPARLWDDLTGVIDDAVFNDDAVTDPAGAGTITYTEPVITWTGALAKDATVTLTYTVTLTGAGDLNVRNVAFAACDASDPDCDTTTPVCDPADENGIDPATGKPCAENEFGLPRIEDSKSVTPSDGEVVVAGQQLTYELSFANTGTAAGNVSRDDFLGLLLDDAEVVSGPTVEGEGSLTATLAGDRIEVRGTLGAGDTATVTYTVEVKPDGQRVADGGDDLLGNFLIDPTTPPPTACEPMADEDSTCNPVPRIVDAKSVDPADGSPVEAGAELTYTLAFENLGKGAGQVSKDDYLGMLLDDAELVDGPTVDGEGSVSATRNGEWIEVRGGLGAGESATVSYTVRVKSDAERVADHGDDMLGNFLLDPGTPPPTECAPVADEDSTCNPVPRIVDAKSVDPADGSPVEAGAELTYTLTFENLGKGAGQVSKDDYLGMLLDDAELVEGPVVDGQGGLTATLNGDRIEVRGTLAGGSTATVTYTVRVRPDAERVADGGDDMLGNFLLDAGQEPPIECDPAPGEDSTCNPVRALVIEKSSDRTAESTFGDTVTYTVTATNTGAGDYPAHDPARVRDDLSGVLDDAIYNQDASPDVEGVVSYTEPVLEWAGALAAGESVTLTYTVTLERGGDLAVRNVAWGGGGEPPESCNPPAQRQQRGFDPGTGRPCDVEEFGIPDLVDSKSVAPQSGTTVVPGQELTYTLRFSNAGTAPVAVDRVDDLTGVLDDAAVVEGPTSSDDALSVSPVEDGRIAVTGELAAGQTVTVTYTVAVNEAGDLGDARLGNHLLDPGQTPPTECDPAGEDSTCNPVSRIEAEKSVDPADGSGVAAGDELTYTLRFTNTGEGTGAVEYVDRMGGVLDDAVVIQEPRASDPALTVSRNKGRIKVTGELAGGQTVTVSYTVRVKAYGEQGDHVLVNHLLPPGVDPREPGACAEGDPTCTRNPITPPADPSDPPSDPPTDPPNDPTDPADPVDPADPADPPGILPQTGGPALLLGGLALALLLGGALLTRSGRRRNT